MKTRKVFHSARTLQSFRENPIEFLLDLVLTTLCCALIPIPFVGELVRRYKKQILLSIGSIVFLVIGFICLLLILLTKSGLTQSSLANTNINGNLQGYIEAGFTDTDIP